MKKKILLLSSIVALCCYANAQVDVDPDVRPEPTTTVSQPYVKVETPVQTPVQDIDTTIYEETEGWTEENANVDPTMDKKAKRLALVATRALLSR